MISLQNHFLFLMFILIFFMYCSGSTGHALNTSIVRCPPHHKFALLQLKREFAFKKPNLSYYFDGPIDETDSYPKMKFWKEGKDCCEWDGVTCNMKTGQVISLDLSSSWLHGPLSSHSSLFTLLELQQLSLAFNNFTFSQIPSSFAHLSRLTHLNLSYSFFSGHVPSEIASLSNLISLDLSSYYHYDIYERRNLLYLSMTTLAKNMTKVRELHLNNVNLSSLLLPQSFANFSSLTSLSLWQCNLHGEFPQNIFQLSNIQVIDVSINENLTGFLPNFHSSSKLKSLRLYHTRFSGTLPNSIGNLKSLNELIILESNFSGTIPSSIGNLSQLVYLDLEGDNFNGQIPSTFGNLSQLEFLLLSGENLNGQLPSTLQNLAKLTNLQIMNIGLTSELPFWLGNLRRLQTLSIAGNRFNGQIPSSLGNLSQLIELYLSGENFDGKFPMQVINLTQLSSLQIQGTSLCGPIPSSLFLAYTLTKIWLDNNQFDGPLEIQNVSSSSLKSLSLSGNNLNGQIPLSVFKFPNLVSLDLTSNNLSGTLNLDSIPKHSKLEDLGLSYNSNITITSSGTSSNLPKFNALYLASCNIGKSFPEFLRSQDKLGSLDISNNKIEGKIPNWFLNKGIETLYFLNLSHNSFIGWETTHYILPWKKLQFLDLRSNRLQGSLVLPPLSIQYFFISKNKLSGRIHPLFCNLSGLVVLDVSNNHLSGTIPPCLGSFNNDLKVLNLKRNNFHGKIPQLFLDGSNLMTLDLSHNQLQGKIPKLLIKCRALEVLDLGHNEISDTFPFWLQNLPELQVLVLCSNKFYGPIWHPHKFFGFLKLRIIDLSFNNFSGSLPSGYFRNWSAINTKIPSPNKSQLLYMKNGYYQNSVTVMNKGLEMVFVKILTIFTIIDLSSNNFYGEIPNTIGDLPSLIVLNLSSNHFKGLIPSSLGNLKQLESLDLSSNKLSGRIPQQLASLSFLAYLDLSENQLTGPIPRGTQISTFPSSSFDGNVELCGLPLSKKCESTYEKPILEEEPEPEPENGFGWKVVLMGYGCGFVIGVIGGHLVISKKPNWFLRIYGRKL